MMISACHLGTPSVKKKTAETWLSRALGLPVSRPSFSIVFTTSMPSTTSPNTTCLPSSHGVEATVMKNCAFERTVRLSPRNAGSKACNLGAVGAGPAVGHGQQPRLQTTRVSDLGDGTLAAAPWCA